MCTERIKQKELFLEKQKINLKLKVNFKNSSLVTVISILNVAFFLGIIIWIGIGIKWQWDYNAIKSFILDKNNKSYGWGALLSLFIFTIIDGIFFIFIYLNIFSNSKFFVFSDNVKKRFKFLSILNILFIIFYGIGWMIIIISFSVFFYFTGLSTETKLVFNWNWTFVVIVATNLLPFFIVLFTFIAWKKTNSFTIK